MESQCESSYCLDPSQEAFDELVRGHVKDIGMEHIPLIENLHDRHSVRERGDVQHIQ